MFGGGARNAGVTAAEGPRDPEVVWRFETPTRMTTDPVGDGTVVVGTIGDSPTSTADGEDFSDPALYGVSAADGSERFRFDLPSPPHGTPAIHDGHIFVETEDDGIYALDATDGGFAWSRSTDATFRAGDVTVSGGTVYLAVDRGVVGRDAATGGVRTRIDIDRALSKAFAIADGVLYVAWDRDDGGSDRSGGLDAVALDGERLWRVESGFPTGGPAVGDGTVVWTTATAAHAHDATTGEERWQFEPARGTGSPAIADGVAYLGSKGDVVPRPRGGLRRTGVVGRDDQSPERRAGPRGERGLLRVRCPPGVRPRHGDRRETVVPSDRVAPVRSGAGGRNGVRHREDRTGRPP
jgi:outer membrane protein assembly factor BamB